MPFTLGPITFYWLGVRKRSIASFVALNALFKMGASLWGLFSAVAAPEPKMCQERVQQIAEFLPNLVPWKFLVKIHLRFSCDINT